MIFFNEKKIEKDSDDFDIENWLWKSEIGIFRWLDLEPVLLRQNIFFNAKCYFIKLPFDAQVIQKILNVI